MKKFKLKSVALGVLTALAMIHAPAQAVDIGFTNEFSGGTDCAVAATGCSILTVTSFAGGVHFELQGTMVAGEFITELSGNYNGPGTLSMVNIGGTGSGSLEGFSFGSNAFKADGDGFFDWKIDLSSNPPRFDGTDTLSWDFLGATLAQFNSLSVDGPEGKTGFLFATHAQGLANGGSGWFQGAVPPGGVPFDVTPVPEPETYALFGMGLAAMAYFRRKKLKGGAAQK